MKSQTTALGTPCHLVRVIRSERSKSTKITIKNYIYTWNRLKRSTLIGNNNEKVRKKIQINRGRLLKNLLVHRKTINYLTTYVVLIKIVFFLIR